jgi:copper chaperone CopZ
MPLGLRVVLVAALSLLAQAAASAEFRRIEITIHGMDCATCAHAVRVAALKIDGVETVTISLQRAVADIRMREGNRVTIEQIRQMVRRSGFTPREASVTVIGSAIERGGAPAIAVSGIDQVLIVNVQRSDAAALKAIEDARGTAPSVVSKITGTLEPVAGQPDQIAVWKICPLVLPFRPCDQQLLDSSSYSLPPSRPDARETVRPLRRDATQSLLIRRPHIPRPVGRRISRVPTRSRS